MTTLRVHEEVYDILRDLDDVQMRLGALRSMIVLAMCPHTNSYTIPDEACANPLIERQVMVRLDDEGVALLPPVASEFAPNCPCLLLRFVSEIWVPLSMGVSAFEPWLQKLSYGEDVPVHDIKVVQNLSTDGHRSTFIAPVGPQKMRLVSAIQVRDVKTIYGNTAALRCRPGKEVLRVILVPADAIDENP